MNHTYKHTDQPCSSGKAHAYALSFAERATAGVVVSRCVCRHCGLRRAVTYYPVFSAATSIAMKQTELTYDLSGYRP